MSQKGKEMFGCSMQVITSYCNKGHKKEQFVTMKSKNLPVFYFAINLSRSLTLIASDLTIYWIKSEFDIAILSWWKGFRLKHLAVKQVIYLKYQHFYGDKATSIEGYNVFLFFFWIQSHHLKLTQHASGLGIKWRFQNVCYVYSGS